MNRTLFTIMFFFVMGIIVSCTTYRFIDLQVLKPAETDTLIKADKLFIINAKKLIIDSVNNEKSEVYIKFLSNFGNELEKILKESPSFANTEIVNTSYLRMLDEYGDLDLTQRKKSALCSVQSVLFTDTLLGVEEDYYMYRLKYRIIYLVNLGFSKLYTPDVITNLLVTDTLYFESLRFSYNRDSIKIKEKNELIYKDIEKNVAQRVVNKIAPFWITVERTMFYYSNKPMVKAYNFYCNNQLDKAISQWQMVYEHATKNIASKAAHNISICYELMDSLSLAEQWINKSVDMKKNSISTEYRRILKKRLKELDLLDRQLLNTKY